MSIRTRTVRVTIVSRGEEHTHDVAVYDLSQLALGGRAVGWHACPPLDDMQPAYATPRDAAIAHMRSLGAVIDAKEMP